MVEKLPPTAGNRQPDNSLDKARQLVEDAKKMGFKIEDTDEFKGVIKDLQKERDRRQQYETMQYNTQSQQPAARKEEDFNSDELLNKINAIQEGDLVTGEQLKDIMKGLTGLVKSGFQTTAQVYTSERAMDSEKIAKERYSPEKVGNDFAYENVIQNYYGKVLQELGNPQLHVQIMNSKDPSEAAYRLALTHPDLVKKQEEVTKNKITEEIQQNLRRTRKLGGTGSLINEIHARQQTRDTLLARSSEDILAELQQDES